MEWEASVRESRSDVSIREGEKLCMQWYCPSVGNKFQVNIGKLSF